MAAKIKKISINALEDTVKQNSVKTLHIDWNGLDITITPTLGIRDVLRFVKYVVDSCFIDGEYMPEIEDFAIKTCMIELYTNLSLPSNTEKKYELIYTSDIAQRIFNNINQDQLTHIVHSIDARIKHIANVRAEALNKQMEDLYAAFDTMRSQFEEIFSDISADDVKGIVGAISDNGFSEEKIVEAFLNQKKNSAQTESE